MIQTPQIAYQARDDATPEAEISVLAAIYRLVVNSANRNAPGVTSTKGDDAMKGSEDDRAKTSLHE
jgi:hypothetical protein